MKLRAFRQSRTFAPAWHDYALKLQDSLSNEAKRKPKPKLWKLLTEPQEP